MDVWTREVFANFIVGKVIGPQFPQVRHDWRLLLAQFRLEYAVNRSASADPIRGHHAADGGVVAHAMAA